MPVFHSSLLHVLILISSGALPAPAQTPAPQPEIREATKKNAPDHQAWTALLGKHVGKTGKVSYAGFKKDKTALEAYLKSLSDNPPAANWSRNEKMAYWINAYNAFTIHLIVENHPISSITKLDGGKTWDVKRIAIGGKKYSLNQIENDILRPQFKDPRIHFAVNCAARSCPPLWNRAFTAQNLETALESRTRQFVGNARFNQIEPETASISKIFEWYEADFPDIRKFLTQYSGVKIASTARISYQEYDWSLNE